MTRLLIALIAGLAVAGCGGTTTAGTRDTVKDVGVERHTPRAGTAAAALERLITKGRAPRTGYTREQFGGDWATVNGCGMRDRVLARDISAGGSGCAITSGTLVDPYTGTRIHVVPGGGEVDVDHVVALGDAWQKGAQQWSYPKRVRFANDPLNLLAVDASANRQKGDSDAASWLPPNKRFRCRYVARQIAVKRRYAAWVTGAEKAAMRRVLGGCPQQRLPTARRVHIAVESTSDGRHFENCDAARAAGVAPLIRGDGVYEANTGMDGDGDGIACE